MKNKKKILCTLGPRSLNEKVISRLTKLGVDIFRLNLSHTKLDDLKDQVQLITSFTNVPVCLDTEGAQIRTGSFLEGAVNLESNMITKVSDENIDGTVKKFSLYPENIIKEILEGDLISIDFDSALLQVIKKEGATLEVKVINGGKIGSNKGVAINRKIKLPFITNKDKEAILIGRELGINHFALSFANSGEDVSNFRDLIGKRSFLISKIESEEGLINRDEILNLSDAILIDRGDLSRDVDIEDIPHTQEVLISDANKSKKQVFVATNLLESMLTSSIPTRAEVNDVYHTLKSGADGLVLAAETAIGLNPIKSASMIRKIIINHDQISDNDSLSFSEKEKGIMPHGGKLCINHASSKELDLIKNIKNIHVDENVLLDAQQIANGTYSPITGFMSSDTLNSVLDNNLLPDGNTWTLPILFQIEDNKDLSRSIGDKVILTSRDDEDIAIMNIDAIEEIDLQELCTKWFGTHSKNHPGARMIQEKGQFIVSGEISLIKRKDSPYKIFDLTPRETRFIFNQKHWDVVIGFHTRNPIHRAHEYIQLKSMQLVNADGIFINPVIGPKKSGDFVPEIVLKSYQTMIDSGIYSSDHFLLGGFNTYSRFSGPREAVFTAICRKNMGCTHFIIGRDHTGFGNYYEKDATKKYFDQINDIGIEPIFFDTVGFDKELGEFIEEKSSKSKIETISGSKIRQAITESKELPNWYMREEILQMIINHDGKKFFK